MTAAGPDSYIVNNGKSLRLFNVCAIIFYAYTIAMYLFSNNLIENYANARMYPKLIKENTLESKDIKEENNIESKINENSTFEISSACLLVSDDNHFLIEWIAYHYHVLNLRHLVITSDPRSQTSPNRILNRWQGKIKVEIWNDTYVFTNIKDMVRYKMYTVRGNNTRFNERRKIHLHRLRQVLFNKKCLRHLKRLNKGWVLLSDTDEYVTINPEIHDYGEKYSIEQPGSVMAFLQNLTMPTPSIQFFTPCVPIYRRQYTAQESKLEEVKLNVPSNFDGSRFVTLRWRKWITGQDIFRSVNGRECSFRRRAGPAKTIIDLERLRYKDLFHEDIRGNPHRPLENVCSSDRMEISAKNAGLIIHHYLGTREQWMYRSADSRGNAYRWARHEILNNTQTVQESDIVSLWLKGFFQSVGYVDASHLLKGVGELEPLPKSDKSNLASYDPEPDYAVGELVQVYLKKEGWRWGEIRDARKYYNVVLLEICREILGVSTNELRRNGTVGGEDISTLLGNITDRDD